MRSDRGGRSIVVALVAALVLLTQSFFGVWASAAASNDVRLDHFGNPLCIGNDVGKAPAGQHETMLVCCAQACAASPVLPAPAAGGAALPPPAASLALGRFVPAAAEPSPPGHDPKSPRAPPLAA